MTPAAQPHLTRRFGLLQATALNVTNMIGIGPFVTIPALMSTINGGGPQCMIGWFAALLVVLPDGLIWAELGAAMPSAGGSFAWLREAYGREKWGRLMAFLFIWQFILSGPMEIGTGFIGLKQYLPYFLAGVTNVQMNAIVLLLGALLFALLYRRIGSVGKITVCLWVGTMLTVGAIIFGGIGHFDPKIAFDFPKNAFHVSPGFWTGLGAAASIGVYDYLGYYDVCYIGEEVREPGKVIPRSIMLSLGIVAVIYLTMNLAIIGVVPWRSFVPAPDTGTAAPVASWFIEKNLGHANSPRLYVHGFVDGIWFDFHFDARLFQNSLRRRARRLFLPRILPAASHERFPPSLAVAHRHPLDLFQLCRSLDADQRAGRDACAGAIHRANRRRDAPAAIASGHAAPVSHLGLSAAGVGRAHRLDFHIFDNRNQIATRRIGRAGLGHHRLPRVVGNWKDLAICPEEI